MKNRILKTKQKKKLHKRSPEHLNFPGGVRWLHWISDLHSSAEALCKRDNIESAMWYVVAAKDEPHVLRASSAHNLSQKYEHSKILFCSSSFCDTWPLIPFFILILVYVPWKIGRLPFTFQHVCLLLAYCDLERKRIGCFFSGYICSYM